MTQVRKAVRERGKQYNPKKEKKLYNLSFYCQFSFFSSFFFSKKSKLIKKSEEKVVTRFKPVTVYLAE